MEGLERSNATELTVGVTAFTFDPGVALRAEEGVVVFMVDPEARAIGARSIVDESRYDTGPYRNGSSSVIFGYFTFHCSAQRLG